MAKQTFPLIALFMGLGSYCLLLLVSQEAPRHSLALMGVLSLFIVVASLGILWQLFRCPPKSIPTPASVGSASEIQDSSQYLEIKDE